MEQDKEEKVDPIYKKGFDHGYWLQRADSSDLDGLIHGSRNHAGYSGGLKAGRNEAIREQFRDRQADAAKSRERNKDKGMEID